MPVSWASPITTGWKCSTANGALTARAVVSQRVPAGYDHDVPRAGTHREPAWFGSYPACAAASITRSPVSRPKPTHMIGGYAHLAWGFNYYGTVGSNRDEFVVVRKMKNVNWLDGEGRRPGTGER